MKTYSSYHRYSFLRWSARLSHAIGGIPPRLSTLACAALTAFVLPATAAPGDVDAGFNPNVAGGNPVASSLALQTNGMTVPAGSSGKRFVRLRVTRR